MLTSALNSICLPYKPFLIFSTLLSYYTSPGLASPDCWQATVDPSFPIDCRYIFVRLPELPALALNLPAAHAAAQTLVGPSYPFPLDTSIAHDSCIIDTTIYGDPAEMPLSDYAPRYLDRPPRPPLLTQIQTRETWIALRESVERILAECSDHGRAGEEVFYALPWGWCHVRVMGVGAAAENGSGRARRLQQQFTRGGAMTRWTGRDVPDNLFGRTCYTV